MFSHGCTESLNYVLLVCFAIITIYSNIEELYVESWTIQPTPRQFTKHICFDADRNSLKARRKSCFLRPDTGPCRADIIQYYFDAKFATCFRFFWGGCQGNGNRFESKEECLNYCYINSSITVRSIPHFCSLAFDFGTCFGHFNRWAWDKFSKTCKRRLYSGCGGNQNNFETKSECMATCLTPPNNTFHRTYKFTTCMPIVLNDYN